MPWSNIGPCCHVEDPIRQSEAVSIPSTGALAASLLALDRDSPHRSNLFLGLVTDDVVDPSPSTTWCIIRPCSPSNHQTSHRPHFLHPDSPPEPTLTSAASDTFPTTCRPLRMYAPAMTFYRTGTEPHGLVRFLRKNSPGNKGNSSARWRHTCIPLCLTNG